MNWTIILTSVVISATVSAITNVVITIINNNRLKLLENKKQQTI